jgi:hypothetical protein
MYITSETSGYLQVIAHMPSGVWFDIGPARELDVQPRDHREAEHVQRALAKLWPSLDWKIEYDIEHAYWRYRATTPDRWEIHFYGIEDKSVPKRITTVVRKIGKENNAETQKGGRDEF